MLHEKKVRKYYDDMKAGLAKPEDFERYLYGGNYDRKFFHDDRDAIEDQARNKLREWEADVDKQIDRVIQEEKVKGK